MWKYHNYIIHVFVLYYRFVYMRVYCVRIKFIHITNNGILYIILYLFVILCLILTSNVFGPAKYFVLFYAYWICIQTEKNDICLIICIIIIIFVFCSNNLLHLFLFNFYNIVTVPLCVLSSKKNGIILVMGILNLTELTPIVTIYRGVNF